MRVVVLPGDDIGLEITEATIGVLRSASDSFGLELELIQEIVGRESLSLHGTTVHPDLLNKVRESDGLVLGPTATLEYHDESNGKINPSKFFRQKLDLFANIRPAKTYTGVSARASFDLTVVRENTEGFYSDRNIESGSSEMLITSDVVISLRRITRLCCERIMRVAFDLARTRRRQLTIVHKANVLHLGDGMFLEIGKQIAREYSDVVVDDVLIDAMMAWVVRSPAKFDVIVTTNMFGDILSDLTAELSGSIGLGSSLNVGNRHAMAQAVHGSAPDIAGKNIANPCSLILSAARLLDWYGRPRLRRNYLEAATAIERAVEAALADGDATVDVGGSLGTMEVGRAISKRLRQTPKHD